MNGFFSFFGPACLVALALLGGGLPPALRADDAVRRPVIPLPGRDDSSSRPLSPPSRSLANPSKTGERRPLSGGSFWKTLSILAGLVTVIFIGGKLLRKHAPHLGGGIPAEALEVLGKRSIDRGQVIYLVRLGSRVLVIGSASGGLQTLAEVSDPLEIDYLAGLCKPRGPQPGGPGVAQGFLALFNRHSVRDRETRERPSESAEGAYRNDSAPSDEPLTDPDSRFPSPHPDAHRSHV